MAKYKLEKMDKKNNTISVPYIFHYYSSLGFTQYPIGKEIGGIEHHS